MQPEQTCTCNDCLVKFNIDSHDRILQVFRAHAVVDYEFENLDIIQAFAMFKYDAQYDFEGRLIIDGVLPGFYFCAHEERFWCDLAACIADDSYIIWRDHNTKWKYQFNNGIMTVVNGTTLLLDMLPNHLFTLAHLLQTLPCEYPEKEKLDQFIRNAWWIAD
jgi:hypothetical protein